MKQRPITTLETAAIQAAVDAALAVRPDLKDESIRALIGMVARDTARNLTEALTNEGYLSTSRRTGEDQTEISVPDPLEILKGLMAKPEEIAAGVNFITTLLAKKVASGVKKPNQ